MKKSLTYTIIFLLFNLCFLFSQNAVLGPESSNWYFGENAGIKFSVGWNNPVSVKGSLTTEEGCASVSDSEGNLLFYASGESIWKRNHIMMKNGWNLPGGHSSTQAVLILQVPGVNDIFFAINTENLGGNLTYSVVDMEADNGYGEVISREVLAAEDIGEKLTAVYHANNHDVWIVTKDKNVHMFRVFLLDESGINLNSVDSYIPLDFDLAHKYSSMGYLNFSPTGDKLVSASYSGSQIELYDFDRSTGKVTNPIVIPVPDTLNPYGVCFSPDGSKLYASYYDYDSYLVQYDLADYDSASISNSRVTIAEYHNGYSVGAIQAGPDEKLYVSRYKNEWLSVINKPNESGANCLFDSNGVFLNGAKSRLGLPNFTYVNNYSKLSPDPNYHNIYFEVLNFEGRPSDKEKSIRIIGKIINENVKAENINLRAKLTFDASAFLPENINNISYNTISENKRVITFFLNNLTLDTSEKVLIEFPGTIMLGNKELNKLVLTDIELPDTSYKVFIKNGYLRISDVCLTNYRKVKAVFTTLFLKQNPVIEDLEINFSSREKGEYFLKIYDLTGNLAYAENLLINKERADIEFEMNISEFIPGLYFITVENSGTVISNTFIKK